MISVVAGMDTKSRDVLLQAIERQGCTIVALHFIVSNTFTTKEYKEDYKLVISTDSV